MLCSRDSSGNRSSNTTRCCSSHKGCNTPGHNDTDSCKSNKRNYMYKTLRHNSNNMGGTTSSYSML